MSKRDEMAEKLAKYAGWHKSDSDFGAACELALSGFDAAIEEVLLAAVEVSQAISDRFHANFTQRAPHDGYALNNQLLAIDLVIAKIKSLREPTT